MGLGAGIHVLERSKHACRPIKRLSRPYRQRCRTTGASIATSHVRSAATSRGRSTRRAVPNGLVFRWQAILHVGGARCGIAAQMGCCFHPNCRLARPLVLVLRGGITARLARASEARKRYCGKEQPRSWPARSGPARSPTGRNARTSAASHRRRPRPDLARLHPCSPGDRMQDWKWGDEKHFTQLSPFLDRLNRRPRVGLGCLESRSVMPPIPTPVHTARLRASRAYKPVAATITRSVRREAPQW